MTHDHKHDGDGHAHKGHDHPQTIDAEPLEQTRSARLLKEQEEKGVPALDDEEDE